MATDYSNPSPTLDFPAEVTKTNQESQKQEAAKENETQKDEFYKTKKINFRGRKKRIILQHKNGPCPLIAICNVLLLRDVMILFTDTFEVSQEELLILVASALSYDDSVFDAMDLVQSFANGIDVDVKFTSIDGFEFTPELAAFDLLEIPLYHGWIVDPEDVKTATAIGSKSYNALTTEPFVLKTPSSQSSGKCSVDFDVSSTATLGVPSLRCSNTRSFAHSPPASAKHRGFPKGDMEEEMALLRALTLSEMEADSRNEGKYVSGFSDENQMSKDDILVTSVDAAAGCTRITLGNFNTCQQLKFDDQFSSTGSGDETDNDVEEVSLTTPITKSSEAHDHDQLPSAELEDETVCDVETENSMKMTVVHVTSSEANLESTKNDDSISEVSLKSEAVTFVNPDLSGRSQDDDVALSEAKKCVSLDSPVYDGKSLVGQSSSGKKDTNELTPEEGELIRKFLKDNASQLTWSGLFELQRGVGEGLLCVLFRNNHFYTMLKHENELYTLVTDEGYQVQEDMVWEKLNEVNGDSVFFTGDFEVFKSDSGKSRKWDQQDAMNETAEFISGINSISNEGMDIDPNLQAAMELQQQYWAEDIDSEVPIIRSNNDMPSSLPEVKATLRWQNVQPCL